MWHRLSTFLFGEKIGDKLPEGVRAAIEQRQHQSERLIGWVQLLLVSFFATLFAVVPPPAEMAPYQLEPWAIGAYFVFTLVRLACAYRNYLPASLLVISAIMDIAVLMALIWSFRVKYM